MSKRTSFLAALLGLCNCFLSPVSVAQDSNEPLPAVLGLDVTVYSGTAAGLKWEGVTGTRAVRGYLIYRENELLGEVDTRSYIVDDLRPGGTYYFAVQPVYASGQPSGATFGIQFSTPGGAVDVVAPDTPSIRAATYSSTAAGIAWTRPTDPGDPPKRVAQYEVRRDGVLVSTTRAVSYIDYSLAPGRDYEYAVVAINSRGGRAAPARITVSTPGTATREPGGSDGDPAVAAPTGLRSSVYSATAGGIAWARASTPGFRYAVSRDGDSLATTDGTSYVDNSLIGGRTYRYDVVAIDRQGRRSAASSVTLNTPGGVTEPTEPPADAPIINVDDHVAILAEVFDTFSGRNYKTELYALPGDVSSLIPVEPGIDDTRSCSNGGTSTYTLDPGAFRIENFDFDNCQIGSDLLEGDLATLVQGNGRRFASEGLTIERQEGGVVRLQGTAGETFDGSDELRPNYQFSGEFSYPVDEGTFELSAADFIRFGYGFEGGGLVFSALMDGGFVLTSPETRGDALTVSIPTAFSYAANRPIVGDDYGDFAEDPEDFTFPVGTLRVVAEDGSRLTLEAANGDGRTATVTIESGGETTTIVQPWSIWKTNLRDR